MAGESRDSSKLELWEQSTGRSHATLKLASIDLGAGSRARIHYFAGVGLAQSEGAVQRLDGFVHTRGFHQEGDVVLRRTLRNGDHVDSLVAQGAENASGDARSAGHIFSDGGDHGHIAIDGDVIEIVVAHVFV